MTSKRSTKRALLSSVVSLLLCFSMLLGTTYAWFTDTVTSATNVIAAGNLDIELTHTNDKVTGATVTAETELFDSVELWEPGAMAWEKFTIKNEGTLALKYIFALNALNETVAGFANLLKVAVIEDDDFDYSREKVQQLPASSWTSLKSFVREGKLEKNGDTEIFGIVIWWQPSEADNDYNRNDTIVSVDVGVVLTATQTEYESDGFGTDYDQFAPTPDGAFVLGATTLNHTAAEAGIVEIKNEDGSFIVKATAEANAEITATIEPTGATEEALTVATASKKNLVSYDIEVTGHKDASEVTLSFYVGKNLLDVEIYHKGAKMTTGATYDIDTGYVTIVTSDFSPFEVLFKYDSNVSAPEETEKGVLEISTAGQLLYLAEKVNVYGKTFEGQTVVLTADIDLTGINWKPIGQNGDKAGFQGTFDGQGHTISNLYVNQSDRAYQAAGFFGSARYATIKNFKIVNATIINLDDAGNTDNGAAVVVGAAQFATTIDNVDVENATVVGNRRVAAIAGYYVGTITNCDVKSVNLTANFDAMGDGSYDNADKVGMIIAYSNGASTISNNTVTGGSIIGYRDIGGIAGYATTSTLTNNSVSGLSIVVNNGHNYKSYADLDAHDAGAIIGEGTADETNVATDVTIEMPVANTEDLIAAIKAGETEIELPAGNYTMPDGSDISLNGKTLTIKGTKETVIDASNVDERDQFVTGATLHFEGVTLNFGNTNYMGFANAASLTYTDCVINGLQFCYGSGQYSFVNCDLNSNGAEHCVWTWGGQNVSFTDCDFTYGDRAVNCYGEGVTTNASFTNCTFTKVAGKETTGAIETNSSTLTALNLTINNCTVNEGDLWWVSPWDAKGGANTHATIDGKMIVGTTNQLITAIKNAPIGVQTTIYLADEIFDGDIKITLEALGIQGGDVVIKAMEGATPVISGTVTLGYRNQGVGATMYNANVTFEGVTFDQAIAATHSIDVQDVKSLALKNCTIIGDGEYGLTSARGNATGTSTIIGCTFKNAGMQLLGNFATGLVIDECTFNESRINVQAGNGVTVQNCEFNATLTAANIGDSFYLIRSNSTPINVKNCEMSVDSNLAEVVTTAQAKWYLLANRGTTNWTVENVEVTLTDAALVQTELDITACTSTGVINTTNLTVNGIKK